MTHEVSCKRMVQVDVRPAGSGDLAAVALLRWRWVVEGGAEPVTGQEEFVRSFVEWAHAHAATHRCTVVVREQQVLGMAWWALVPRVPTPRALQRTSGDVQSVYVVPEERGAGLGGRLVEAVLAEAAGQEVERVTVHSSARAVPMYVRAGFSTSPLLLGTDVR